MDRIIFHVDVNSAFLSWEAVFRLRVLGESLDLRSIPSAVGGDRDARRGIILAKSIPAKAFDIRTAEPITDALRKCPKLVIVPPRPDFYRECSHAFMDILREYSDLVEPFSVDEAFVDLSASPDCKKDPMAFANMLRLRIREELGFTVNIGVAENKLLAKTASDFTKPDRCHSLFQEEIPDKFWPLPAGDLLYVGASTAARLKGIGIHTIGELAQTDESLLVTFFGKGAAWLHNASNGIDNSPVSTERSGSKGYGNSTTLAKDLHDAGEAKQVLLGLCESVASRLRHDNVKIKVVAVSIRDKNFNTHSRQVTLDNATCITSELYECACRIFDQAWDGRTPIRQLGVHTSGVTDDDSRQISLFDSTDYAKLEKADRVMDALRDKFGKDAVKRGSLLK